MINYDKNVKDGSCGLSVMPLLVGFQGTRNLLLRFRYKLGYCPGYKLDIDTN
jgi:hypothetical protein